MKKYFLFSFFSAIGFNLFSQDFILDKRSKIKHKMEKYYSDNNRKYSFSETDSTVTYILNDSISLPATNIFYFSDLNRCIKQEIIFTCDSCMQRSMQQSLSNKFINWKQTGPQSYYAGFPYNVLMEQGTEKGMFILRFTSMKKKDVKKPIPDNTGSK